MRWYALQQQKKTEAGYFSRAGDLEAHDPLDFFEGRPIQGWKGDAWVRSLSSREDGPPSDSLANHFSLFILSERARRAVDDAFPVGIQYLPIRVLTSDDSEYPHYSVSNLLVDISARTASRDVNTLRAFNIVRVKGSPSLWVSEQFVNLWSGLGFTGCFFDRVSKS